MARDGREQDEAATAGEVALAERLVACMDDELTLAIGSGIGAPAVPRVSNIIELADEYALGRDDGGDLSRALGEARTRLAAESQTAVYAEYRRLQVGAREPGSEVTILRRSMAGSGCTQRTVRAWRSV